MNIMTSNPGFKPSVSLELNASYLKPALMNKQLFIASQILKTGKQTAVAEIKFYDEVKNHLYNIMRRFIPENQKDTFISLKRCNHTVSCWARDGPKR